MKVEGINSFLNDNPFMKLEPITSDAQVIISGELFFNLSNADTTVTGSYQLRISIPKDYPRIVPCIEEVGGKIPKKPDYHVNYDGTLCLASPLRLQYALSKLNNINNYFSDFLLPYLFAITLKIEKGIDFIFGELPHGNEGELTDYQNLFGLSSKQQVIASLGALSQKKRIANKKGCPCDCGKRLGSCELHYKLNKFRGIVSRSEYKTIQTKLLNIRIQP